MAAPIIKLKEEVESLRIEFRNFTIRDYNYKFSLLNNPQRKIKMPLKSVKSIGNFTGLVTKDGPRPGNIGELPNAELIPNTIGDVYNLNEIDYCKLSMFYNENFGIESNSSLEDKRNAFFEWLGCNIYITGTPQ